MESASTSVRDRAGGRAVFVDEAERLLAAGEDHEVVEFAGARGSDDVLVHAQAAASSQPCRAVGTRMSEIRAAAFAH